MKRNSSSMSDCLSHLVQTIVWSTPVEDPHAKQQQQGRIVNLPPVNHTKPFGPVDHMGPQPIIKEKVWEDIIPPLMVCSHLILPLLADPMEGILGDLPTSLQHFYQEETKREITSSVIG